MSSADRQATNWTGTALSSYGLLDQYNRIGDLQQDYQQGIDSLISDVQGAASFQPYTTTAATGTTSVDAQGNVNMELNPYSGDFQQYVNNNQYSRDAFDRASGSYEDYYNNTYNALRAVQQPEEERQRLALDDRLTAQGRSGIRSAAYGGTPEQLALARAQAEAQNSAAVQAQQLANQRQMQDASLGGLFQRAAYLPQTMLMNQAQLGNQTNQLRLGQQLGLAGLTSQLGLGGQQVGTNLERVRADLMAGLFGTLSNAATNSGFDPIGDIGAGLWDTIGGWLGL